MAKIKYDVSKVEDLPDRAPAPVGVYRAKIVKAEPKESSKGNQMIEVQYRLTHDGAGKKLKEEYGDLWDYPILDHEHPFVKARLKEFITALGFKSAGTIDTDKIVGKSVQVKLKSDTDQDGDYRPRVGKVMGLPTEDIEEPDEDDEDESEDGDEEELDLDAMSRKELKDLIAEEELDIKVKKSMSDDDIRAAIAELLGEDEDEDEEDEDEEEDDDTESEDEDDESDDDEDEEGDNYDEMSPADLKAELKERELPVSGKKSVLIARLRKDDEEEPF